MTERLKAKVSNWPLRRHLHTWLKAAAKRSKNLILEPLGNLQKLKKIFWIRTNEPIQTFATARVSYHNGLRQAREWESIIMRRKKKKKKVKVAYFCPTLCDPKEPTRLLCPWDSPSKNTGVGSHSLLQGIFPIQGSNLVSCIADRFFSISATKEALQWEEKDHQTSFEWKLLAVKMEVD